MADAAPASSDEPFPTLSRAGLERWRVAGRQFVHDGLPVFVRAARNPAAHAPASTLLCLHGFPTASYDWSPLWAALSQRHGQVLAFDMLGYGFSAKPAGRDFPIPVQADIAEALLASAGVRAVHLLAHDVGDTVAQELLARDLERRAGDRPGALRIASCVLLNGGLFPETHRASRAQRLLLSPLGVLVARLSTPARFMSSFCSVFGPDTQPSAEEQAAYWAMLAAGDGHRRLHRLIRYIVERRVHRERWVGALRQTPVPLHLVDGALDPISGAHMVERYRALIPNPSVTLLPEIGHYPQTEAPAAVLAAVDAFHAALAAR